MSKTKAAIYARSNEDEELKGYGIAAQIERGKEVCADKGWEVSRIYQDIEDASGGLPSLKQLIEDAGQFDEILVWHGDKLSTDKEDMFVAVGRFNAAGVVPTGWTTLSPYKPRQFSTNGKSYELILQHAPTIGSFNGRRATVMENGATIPSFEFQVGISLPRLAAIAKQTGWRTAGFYEVTEAGALRVATELTGGMKVSPTLVLQSVDIYLFDPNAFYDGHDSLLPPNGAD